MPRQKKIRGWRRHYRSFQRQAQSPASLDQTHLASSHYDHARIGLAPWGGTSHVSNPPLPFQVEALKGLLTTYTHWQAELTNKPEPCYLAVWVFDLDFGESQVVVGLRERKQRYEHLFGLPVELQPPLPELLRRTPGTEQLLWRAYNHCLPRFYASDWDSPARLVRYLRGRRYRPEPQPDGDTLYWLHRGWVWVGRSA